MSIKDLNISITGKCNANCIYCPDERAARINKCDINNQTLQKIIEKIPKNIKYIYPCENGEFLIHPQAIEIIRILKKSFKKARIEIFTNFSLLNPKIAETLIKDKLINGITTNQDGISKEGCLKVKKMSISPSRENLLKFIELRNKYKSQIKITISVHTSYRYAKAIQDKFGCLPQKLFEIPKDEEAEIIKFWTPKLIKGKDRMLIPVIHAWAERNNPNIKDEYKKEWPCPLYSQIQNTIYIAASGDVHICNYDFNYEMILGNINHTSLEEILKQRQKFLSSQCSFSWACVKSREKEEIF